MSFSSTIRTKISLVVFFCFSGHVCGGKKED